MNGILGNLTPVVKNLLLLNVIMFVVSWLGMQQGIPMINLLGGHVFTSPFFEPYQMVTHFFMHGGFFHILFNMFALVIFGPALEQVWGPKRFFIFFIATAIGAFLLHQFVGYIELSSIKNSMIEQGINVADINLDLREFARKNPGVVPGSSNALINSYAQAAFVPVVGASGAIYGILVAFAYLFPNTQLMLLFPPIPVKAKWLVLFMVGIALYNSFQNNPGDNVAHLAHLGGAFVGFIIVFFWQKNTRNFY
jgi:membrane associated rhomboid family serine protease